MANESVRSRDSDSSEKYWEKQVALWRRSGLNQSAFCREHKLSRWSFHYWRKKLLRKSREAVSFVKLPAISINSAQPAAISVRLADRYSVEVKSEFEAATLRRLLDVLEERSHS